MSVRMELETVAREWMKLWQGGDLSSFDALHSPDFVDHSSAGRGDSRESFKAGIADLYRAFPDFYAEIDDLIFDEPKQMVVVRWQATGTHKQSFMGIDASNRTIDFAGIEIIHIQNDQIIERWGEWNGLEILGQLTD